jgi:hypothetical protein
LSSTQQAQSHHSRPKDGVASLAYGNLATDRLVAVDGHAYGPVSPVGGDACRQGHAQAFAGFCLPLDERHLADQSAVRQSAFACSAFANSAFANIANVVQAEFLPRGITRRADTMRPDCDRIARTRDPGAVRPMSGLPDIGS